MTTRRAKTIVYAGFGVAIAAALALAAVSTIHKAKDETNKSTSTASATSADETAGLTTASKITTEDEITSIPYNPQLDPSDFTTNITNPYMTVKPGQKFTYEPTEAGGEGDVITIEKTTKNINGFTVVVSTDRDYDDGELVEVAHDYMAQNKKTGDVWYFGEDVDNYKNGKIKDHEGSFHHGEDGAYAGILIKAVPLVGDSYRQEYLKGSAEDIFTVKAINQTVTTKLATYTGCVKFYAWTPLEKNEKEYKYHCPGVATQVSGDDVGEDSHIELTKITQN